MIVQIFLLAFILLVGSCSSTKENQSELKYSESMSALGLNKNDVIKAIDGVPVNSIRDAQKAMASTKGKDRVTITVLRDGELVNLHSVIK